MASTFRRKKGGGSGKSIRSAGVPVLDRTRGDIKSNRRNTFANDETVAGRTTIQEQERLKKEQLGPSRNNTSVITTTATTTNTASNSLFRGCKPWSGGITRTSFGLRDLDSILGGGQPLGTCVLLEHTDKWTQQALTSCLLRYWCAEAISHDQCLWIPTTTDDEEENGTSAFASNYNNYDDDGDERMMGSSLSSYNFLDPTEAKEFIQSLPRNLHWDKYNKKKGLTDEKEDNHDRELMETLAEEEEEEEEEEYPTSNDKNNSSNEIVEEGLKNAWQYSQKVQQERSGVSTTKSKTTINTNSNTAIDNVYCHSYDLTGCLMDQCNQEYLDLHTDPIRKRNPTKNSGGSGGSSRSRKSGYQLFRKLYRKLQNLLHVEQNSNLKVPQINKVVRILFCIKDEDYSTTTIPAFTIALSLLLYEIRKYQWPVVIFVSSATTTTTSLQQQSLVLLRRLVDIVLQGEHFASRYAFPPPIEFRHLHGLCMIPKVTTMTGSTANGMGGGHYADLTTTRRPLANIYGFKRDNRKLHIQLLHIPPAGGGGDEDDDDDNNADNATRPKPTAGGCSTHMMVQQQSGRGVPTGGGGGSGGGGGGSMMDF